MSDTPRSRLSTWMWFSLLLNVFLVGGTAGGTWRWWTEDARAERAAPTTQASAGTTSPQAPQRGLRFAADGLAPAQQQAFRAGLREVRREAADLARSSREGRVEVARLLAAPQFDRNAVEAALARTRAADLALRERVEGHVVNFAATLSPADRVTLVQALSAQQGPFRVPPPPAKP